MTRAEFEYMKEAMAADLAELLSKDFGMSISEALDTLYDSETYTKLCDPATGLYFQSTKYVYTLLNSELKLAGFHNPPTLFEAPQRKRKTTLAVFRFPFSPLNSSNLLPLGIIKVTLFLLSLTRRFPFHYSALFAT